MSELLKLIESVKALHLQIHDAVQRASVQSDVEKLSAIASDGAGDTIYAVDIVSENLLVEHLGRVARQTPLILVAEGLPAEGLALPKGTAPTAARWRLIVDPIDGTRGIMYQKRSAWVLTGVARNRGSHTSLGDIEAAVQTEIPTAKGDAFDQLWAYRGQGVKAVRRWRSNGRAEPLVLRPSRAASIEHGYAGISRFFPGVRDELAAIDEEIVRRVLGDPPVGKAHCFEDQYASTGGQLYELMVGHDRFNADLRATMKPVHERRGLAVGICCHPYDLSSVLIAEELGVHVTSPTGTALDAPLDLDTDVSWVAYANDAIRRQMEKPLQEALRRRGLI